jgi:hypothetical protein
MRIVLAFEVKRLPDSVEEAFAAPKSNGVTGDDKAQRVLSTMPGN